tara:strand:- start:59 stop:916 length:858 start_codon:yes stop_codon:yes gene_type:complete
MENRLILFNLSDEEFTKIVLKSTSINNIIKKIFGKHLDMFYPVRNKINSLNLNTEHFIKRYGVKKIDINDILVENSTYLSTKSLKYRLYEENLKEEKCEECGLGNIWNGKPIELQLDHINGKNNDNRLDNLRILCSNCHSQTTTFCKKTKKDNTKRRPSKDDFIKDLLELKYLNSIAEKYEVSEEAVRQWLKLYNQSDLHTSILEEEKNRKNESKIESSKCPECKTRLITKRNKSGICVECKSKKPYKEELQKDLLELKTKVAIAKKYGVSDNGVKKWLKKYELI